jgi:hypothetical protein
MTQDDAFVTAFRSQVLRARIAAGVRHQPRIEGRVVLLRAVAAVPGGDLLLRVSLTAFRAAPLEDRLLVGVGPATGI